jgi:thiol:disulfide interchange protein DsbD
MNSPASLPLRASRWLLLSAVLLLAAPLVVSAPVKDGKKEQGPPKITFTAEVFPADPFSDANQRQLDGLNKPRQVRPGEVFTLIITGKPAKGFHTYPLTRRSEDQGEESLCILNYEKNPFLTPLYPISESSSEMVNTGVSGRWLEHEHAFTWTQEVFVSTDAPVGLQVLKAKIRSQVCDESACTWIDTVLDVPVEITKDQPLEMTEETKKKLEAKQPPIEVVPVPAKGGTGGGTGGTSGDNGLLAFMLQGIFWGAVSLITPCVFPMIPITVSFFLKQSEKKEHRAVTMAVVYSVTIIIVLTIAAVALLSAFRWLSTNPIMNFGLGLLFIFFALSLFGMYEIELPSGLAQYTSAREGQGGLVGTIFMALTFTIISFACVAPFLGGFGGTAANSNLSLMHRVLGGLAFSVTFAAPFFILALFPSLLKKMPKSGGWLNSVKVVMGFLEIAAAIKFLRAGEKVLLPSPVFFTYDFSLSLYIAISLLCGLYLLGFYRLPHDTPSENLGVSRMLLAGTFIGLGFYMMPGLAKAYNGDGERQWPTGAVYAWIDSFLLPDESSNLPWTRSLDKGLAQAREKGQNVFVDFTGETCTNCALNERDVFSRKEVKALLKRYSLVQLYTDKVPNRFYSPEEQAQFKDSTTQQREDAYNNLEFQRKEFGTEQLPLYVILKPTKDGRWEKVASYEEGKINNIAEFMEFLRSNARGQ